MATCLQVRLGLCIAASGVAKLRAVSGGCHFVGWLFRLQSTRKYAEGVRIVDMSKRDIEA